MSSLCMLRLLTLVLPSQAFRLQNGLLDAELSSAGLLRLADLGTQTSLQVDDSWSVQVSVQHEQATLDPTQCQSSQHLSVADNDSVTSVWTCNFSNYAFEVDVTYRLRAGQRFISKSLRISSSESTFTLDAIHIWNTSFAEGRGCPESLTHKNPSFDADIVSFLRFDRVSAFVSVANPFFKVTQACPRLAAGYHPSMEHNSSFPDAFHAAEDGVLGFTSRGQYTYPDGVFVGEKMGFKACAESYYSDGLSRRQTVKVNVAWDESDYQIDVGTAAGIEEYKRIIDRNAELGVDNIVYEPQNSLHSSRFNTTDEWGWEQALWFSMGEKLREGNWIPQKDPVPQDILDMVSYAASKGVKLLAYVYPCLAFKSLKQYEFGTYNVLDLSQPPASKWLLETLSAFMTKSGAGGFSWDHDVMTMPARPYPQWRAWMGILKELRQRFPDIVMDHRQQNHAYGPWYQMSGSYAEPLGSDENPETYGVDIPSLHADHIAADHLRKINYIYSSGQMLPALRVPGFMFHQAERGAPEGGTPCEGSNPSCFPVNVRDFDFLGYKYSVISNVATAGLNNVLTMIPARDIDEYRLFPKEELSFIRDWIAWTDQHMDALRRAAPIPNLPSQPAVGTVDGWHAMTTDDAGFIFLFNPGFRRMRASIILDESVGISNASRASIWQAVELHPNPQRRPRGPWHHGESVTVEVEGSGSLVLELKKLGHASDMPSFIGFGRPGEVARIFTPGNLEVQALHCEGFREGVLEVDVTFAGAPVYHAMPISSQSEAKQPFQDHWFNTSFMIPAAIPEQLQARASRYPVQWTSQDLSATWLAPARLLMTIFMAKPDIKAPPQLWINGTEVPVKKASNSRDAPAKSSQHTFLGYYFDASSLVVDVPHSLSLFLGSQASSTQFQGLYWENVETLYTSEIASCTAVETELDNIFI